MKHRKWQRVAMPVSYQYLCIIILLPYTSFTDHFIRASPLDADLAALDTDRGSMPIGVDASTPSIYRTLMNRASHIQPSFNRPTDVIIDGSLENTIGIEARTLTGSYCPSFSQACSV